MSSKHTILLRARIVFLAVVLAALAVIGKVVYLQSVQGARWKKAATANCLVYRPIPALRGNILADDGSLLATSLRFYRVAFDPGMLDEDTFQKHINQLAQRFSAFYGDKSAHMYKQLMQEARKKKRRYLCLNNRLITYQERNDMLQWPFFKQVRGRGGILFEERERRFKPFQNLALRTLGTPHINGIEYHFNDFLQGTGGRALYKKMMGGHWKLIYKETNPVHGYDVETTLDIHLQDVVHSSLLHALQQSQAQYGCVIVMEVATGEIKAMVNLTRTTSGHYEEQYNYAVGSQGAVEPGSGFKLVTMLALLEETDIALTDPVDTGNGTFQFYDRTMRDVKKGGYGTLTVQEVFEKSSNIGIARLTEHVFGKNPHKFIEYIHRLRLDQPLGFQIQGEGIPCIITPQSPLWSGVTLPWMAIGYNIEITPLQLLSFYNAVANGGTLIQPIIVKKIKQTDKTIKTFQGAILNKKICSDTTLQKLKTVLAGTVERGNSQHLKHSFYKIAGKTGTANKVLSGQYTQATHTSFIGYFPAEAPQYSCIVVIDTPQGAAYHFGSQAAAPVFKDVVDKMAGKGYSTLDTTIPPTSKPPSTVGHRDDLSHLYKALYVTEEKEQPAAEWVQATIQNNTLVWKQKKLFPDDQVPDVSGMTLKDALFILENRGMQVTFQGYSGGRVLTQSIKAGTDIAQHRIIYLQLH